MKILMTVFILLAASISHAKMVEIIEFELKEITVKRYASKRDGVKMIIQCKGDQSFDDLSFQTENFDLPANNGQVSKKIKMSGETIVLGPDFFKLCSKFNKVIVSIEDLNFFGRKTLLQKDIYELLYSKYSDLVPGESVNLKIKGKIDAKVNIRSKLLRI